MTTTDAAQKKLPDALPADYDPRPVPVRVADEFTLVPTSQLTLDPDRRELQQASEFVAETLARLADAEVA